MDRDVRAGPFAMALRRAIEDSGLSLRRISRLLAEQRLRVSPTALSYWQSGLNQPRRRVSVRAVRALERVLGLEDAALVRLLGAPGAAPVRPVLGSRELWRDPSFVERLLRELGPPARRADGVFSVVCGHVSYRVGLPGGTDSTEIRRVVRAHADRVDRVVVVHHGEHGPAGLEARAPCRIGRCHTDPDSGYMVGEVILDRMLREGDTAVAAYRWSRPVAPADTVRRYCLPRAATTLMLEVEFPPGALPVSCAGFHSAGRGGRETPLGELWAGRTGRAHLVVTDAAPGAYGIRWIAPDGPFRAN